MNTYLAVFACVQLCLVVLGTTSVSSAGTVESAAFTNRNTQLSGAIHFPAQSSKAGVVLIHGSSKNDSLRMTALAKLLAERGFAVITYDKRGVGQSEGEFQFSDDERAFSLLAEDVQTAFEKLSKHPGLKDLPVGLLGISQGGWVGPIAASHLPTAAFMVLWSGPLCTVSEEVHFSAMAKRIPNFSSYDHLAKIQEHMESAPARAGDFDPRPILSQLSLPVLWIFGGRDDSIPVELSVARLQEMIEQGHQNFEYKLFPEQGHGLDYPTSYPNGYEYMVSWIEKVAQQTAARDRAKSTAREQ